MVTDFPSLGGSAAELWGPLSPHSGAPMSRGACGELQDPVGIPGHGNRAPRGHMEGRDL